MKRPSSRPNSVTSKKNNKKGGGRRSSVHEDPFFEPDDPKRRRKTSGRNDDIIVSDDSDDGDLYAEGVGAGEGGDGEGNGDVEETAEEKRYRMAMEKLEHFRALSKKFEEEGGGRGDEDDGDEGIQGKRDALVADFLQKEQLEMSGRVQRTLANRVQKPEDPDAFRIIQKHRQSVTAVALTYDDSTGFSVSKDGTLIQWDVESGIKVKYLWPIPTDESKKQSKHILAMAVSSDSRYLATGGLDRSVHIWDIRTRNHIQAFQGHKGPVSCLAFREGTSELFSGSFDRMIKWWNVEDRCHLNNLFGHQAEVLIIDCLRKERILSVGRDHSLRLFKVIEESSLRFSTPTSALECCCFINNEEFLSGSDDGSIELWNILRRKPVHVVKNAHSVSVLHDQLRAIDSDKLCNGEAGHAHCKAEGVSSAQSWVSSITVCKGSDLAASGAGNGLVQLWAVESDSRIVKPLYGLPLVGFVNSLAFARSGRFLLAGVGQEPRLGRWGRIPTARNGVALHSLRLSEET